MGRKRQSATYKPIHVNQPVDSARDVATGNAPTWTADIERRHPASGWPRRGQGSSEEPLCIWRAKMVGKKIVWGATDGAGRTCEGAHGSH